MFRLDQIGPIRGDCTTPYVVILDKDYTVAEFVQTVASKTDDWGHIRISNGPSCEYKWGKLISTLPEEIQAKKVISAKADGGWTMLNYELVVEEETCSTYDEASKTVMEGIKEKADLDRITDLIFELLDEL